MKKWGGLDYDTLYSSNLCININCCKKGCQIPSSTFNRSKIKMEEFTITIENNGIMIYWFFADRNSEKLILFQAA